MSVPDRPDVERIPADLDRFLGNFFDRHDWRSEIRYEPAENRLYLDVRIADERLSTDDRFLSLVEYFSRAQQAVLGRGAGLQLQCRLFAADGSDLSLVLHERGSSYLDDEQRSPKMRRRLAWLSFRRRLVRHILPGALAWAGAIVLVVVVFGLPAETTLWIATGAIMVQYVVVYVTTSRRRS